MRNLGSLEGAVMGLLWAADGPRTVRGVLDGLIWDKELAYTTVMTVLDNLHRKGFVDRRKTGRAFAYMPAISKEQHTAELLDGVLAGTGDRGAALLHFIGRMSAEEQAELKALLQRLDEPTEP